MNRKKLSYIFLLSFLFSLGLNIISLSANNSDSMYKSDAIVPKTSKQGFLFEDTSIWEIVYGGWWADWFGSPMNTIEFHFAEVDSGIFSKFAFSWCDSKTKGSGYGYTSFTFSTLNRYSSGVTGLSFSHWNNALYIFNDSNTRVPYDNVFTLNISTNVYNAEILDAPILEFFLTGSPNIISFDVYDVWETIEKGTSTFHWGYSKKVIRKNGNINCTAVIKEIYHFSARNGVAKIKWDFVLENVSIHPNFVPIGYENSTNWKVANLYEVGGYTSPCQEAQCPLRPSDFRFTGTQISNTNSYLVDISNVNAGEMNLGQIDFRGNYFWNDTKYYNINTTICYKHYDYENNINNMIMAQTFNTFDNESIEVDPRIRVDYLEPDEDDDEEEEKLINLITKAISENYIIPLIVSGCAGAGIFSTDIILKKLKKGKRIGS